MVRSSGSVTPRAASTARLMSSRSNVARAIAERDAAARIHAVDVAAADADDRAFDGHAGHAFRRFERAANRAGDAFEIDDEALANAFRFGRAHGEKLEAHFIPLADQRARFRAADVERHQMFIFFSQAAALPWEIAWASGAKAPKAASRYGTAKAVPS